MNEPSIKLKWYLSTEFISVLMFFWWLIVPFAFALMFIVMQRIALKKIKAKAAVVDDAEKYLENEKARAGEIVSAAEKNAAAIDEQAKAAEGKLERVKEKIQTANAELKSVTAETRVAYVSPYTFDENITSAEYKNKLSLLRVQQNEFFKSDKCVVFDKSVESTSKRALNSDIKQLLRCFNSEASNIISNVTVRNADSCRSKLQKTFEVLNKLFVTDGVSLNKKCLELKLDELTLIYDYSLKVEQEKEQQKAIKEQMIEEEKVRREIEREKARIEKEEKQFRNEIQKLMGYLHKAADVEKQLYVDKIRELEEKVSLLEKDKDNVLQREQNTRAGFVYIISNIGSFGENVYKIGMTRRLEPMDRVKELGSASVPFEFDVHAMIFSDDAPALENILHKTFEENAVNKVNPRKEFYRIDLKAIEDVVKNNHNATVEFTEVAKAEQYRETLKLEQKLSWA